MLGKAPGTELLNEWYGVYNASVGKGMSPEAALLEVANHIAASSAFTSMYPFFITNAEFATEFLTAALGEAPSAEVLALATGLLNGGMGRGEMGLLAVQQLFEIRMQGESHPAYGDFGAIAMMFANKVQVATYYTVEKRWEGASSSVLGGVTGDGDSVTAAKETIDMMRRPGKSFELTTGVDRLDGTLGDDTFVATEKTLTGVDRLDGGEGMDTLELSSSGSGDDVDISSGASVMNVETLTVDSGGDFSADLSGWEGLMDVVLSDVAGDVELNAGGADVVSESLGDDDKDTTIEIMNAAAVNLEDVNARAQVNIFGTDTTTSVMVEGGMGVEVGKSTAHSETVRSVTLDGVHDGMGDDGKRYGENTPAKAAVAAVPATQDGGEGTPAVAAVPAKNNKDSVPVHIYSKVIESVDLRNTNTTLLVENAARDMTELTVMVDRFGNTANGHGKLCLKGIEDLMIEVKGDSNIRLASDQIKTVVVSGAGDLTLSATKFAPAVAEKAADVKPSETLEKLTLSGSGKTTLDAMGLKKLKTVDASDASGAVKLSNLGASVTSYMGSAGKDEVSAKAFAKDGLKADLGAGDDTFTVDNAAAGAKSRIDGGAGMDTLVLKEKTGANLKGAGDAYTGFETITLDAGGGSGIYDVKDLGVDELMVSGGGAGKITFKNVMSGTGLAVSSKPAADDSSDPPVNKATATAADVSYMLADGDDDSLTLKLHTYGGKGDKKSDFVELIAGPRMKLTLALDKDVEELTVHSTATVTSTAAAAVRPKVTNYVNYLSVAKGNEIEEIKVIGEAPLIIDSHSGREGFLDSLTYLDARESSGGVYLLAELTGASGNPNPGLKVDGSPVDDIIFGNGYGAADTLMGHGGNDLIVHHSGEDKITGGAGGDIILRHYGFAALATTPDVVYTYAFYAGTNIKDSNKDTFIYTAASDSQVNFGDKMTGFDIIAGFEKGVDKIDLSSVLDLRGGIKQIANSGNSNLKTVVGDGDGLFMSDATATAFAEARSIALVTTTEDQTKFESPPFFAASNVVSYGFGTDLAFVADNGNITLDWVLVDVDGDGDFSAGTDMAIALAGVFDGPLTPVDFI